MPQPTNTIANGGLSQEVRKVLDVPPIWVIRNGGFLIIAFIALIAVLFNTINMSQSFVSQVRFEKPVSLATNPAEIRGTVTVANRFLELIKSRQLLKLADKQNNKAYYYARVLSIKEGRDSSIVDIDFKATENGPMLTQIKAKDQLKMSVDLGSASIMADILKSHKKQ